MPGNIYICVFVSIYSWWRGCITSWYNSTKPWVVPCRATQDRRVIGESSDRTLSTGWQISKPLQYSCHKSPMNSMKRPKEIWHWKMGPPTSGGVQCATWEEERAMTNSSRKNGVAGPKEKQRPVVAVSGDESKVRCCKEHYCIGICNVRSVNQGKLDVVKHEMQQWTSTS